MKQKQNTGDKLVALPRSLLQIQPVFQTPDIKEGDTSTTSPIEQITIHQGYNYYSMRDVKNLCQALKSAIKKSHF